ncbi:hypothetical protein E4U15_006266, partial [Claviceps sp. LM218 group G6]
MPFDAHGSCVETGESGEHRELIRVRASHRLIGGDWSTYQQHGHPFLPKLKQVFLNHQRAIGSQKDAIPASCGLANKLDEEGKLAIDEEVVQSRIRAAKR